MSERVDRRKRPRGLRPRTLALEALDARDMLALISVGPSGNFTTVQAAVRNAQSGDTIQIAPTLVENSMQESVDLSLMGSAIGKTPGNLTITGDAGTTGTTIVATAGGSVFFNSAPFTGDLRFEHLTLRPITTTPHLQEYGINLDSITGNIAIKDLTVLDAVDGGIEITNSGGAGALQSTLTIEDVEIDRSLDAPTPIGIHLSNLRMVGALHDIRISAVTDVGIFIETAGTVETSLTLASMQINAAEDVPANDGVRVHARDSSRLNVSISVSDFNDLPGNSVEALAANGSRMSVTMFGVNGINNNEELIRVAGEPALRFTSQDTARMAVAVDNNVFSTIPGDAVHVRALGSSVMNANISRNIMNNIGKANDHEAILINGDTASTATVNAIVQANDISQTFGSSIRVVGNGASIYNVNILDNTLSYSPPFNTNAAEIHLEGIFGNLSTLNFAVRGNTFTPQSSTNRLGIFANQASSGVKMNFEFTGSDLDSYLVANNPGSAGVSTQIFAALAEYRKPINTFQPFIPLPLGDFIWRDTNENGVQDGVEPGVRDVVLRLTGTETVGGAAVSQTVVTNEDGAYSFGALLPGTYTVALANLPTGFVLTGINRSTASTTDIDEQFDSDFQHGINQTTVTLVAGADNADLDAGIVPTNGFLWQNQLIAEDVDDNGLVTPLDALLIIIDLNTPGRGPRTLPLTATPTNTPSPFFDVSGDGAVSPLDALLVIIQLNSGNGGEGESPGGIESAMGTVADDATGATPSDPPLYLPPEFYYGAQGSNAGPQAGDDEDDALDAFFAGLGE